MVKKESKKERYQGEVRRKYEAELSTQSENNVEYEWNTIKTALVGGGQE